MIDPWEAIEIVEKALPELIDERTRAGIKMQPPDVRDQMLASYEAHGAELTFDIAPAQGSYAMSNGCVAELRLLVKVNDIDVWRSYLCELNDVRWMFRPEELVVPGE